jgi:hypothetical protein
MINSAVLNAAREINSPNYKSSGHHILEVREVPASELATLISNGSNPLHGVLRDSEVTSLSRLSLWNSGISVSGVKEMLRAFDTSGEEAAKRLSKEASGISPIMLLALAEDSIVFYS